MPFGGQSRQPAHPGPKPITGRALFSHESGVHCAGLIRDPATYQPFAPEDIGRKGCRFVLGTHSGMAVIRHLLSGRGISLAPADASRLRDRIREEARRRKTALTTAAVVELYHQSAGP